MAGFKHALVLLCALAATQVLFYRTIDGAPAQMAATLPQVKKICVASFGGKQGATDLRDRLILRLKKCRGIEVSGSPSETDAVLAGAGETWLNGYINTHPKPSPYNRHPVYDG